MLVRTLILLQTGPRSSCKSAHRSWHAPSGPRNHLEIPTWLTAGERRHILRDSDAVCEDDPTVNARDIYVGRNILREILRYLEAYLCLFNHGDGAMGPISSTPSPRRYEEADDRNAYAGLFPSPPNRAAEDKRPSDLMSLVAESMAKTSVGATFMPAATLESSVDSFVKEAEPTVGPTHAERYEAVRRMNDHLVHLLNWLDEEFRTVSAPVASLRCFIAERPLNSDQKLGRLLPTRISYNLLWTVLYEGALAKVTHETSGEPQGIVVTQTWYGKSHVDGP